MLADHLQRFCATRPPSSTFRAPFKRHDGPVPGASADMRPRHCSHHVDVTHRSFTHPNMSLQRSDCSGSRPNDAGPVISSAPCMCAWQLSARALLVRRCRTSSQRVGLLHLPSLAFNFRGLYLEHGHTRVCVTDTPGSQPAANAVRDEGARLAHTHMLLSVKRQLVYDNHLHTLTSE